MKLGLALPQYGFSFPGGGPLTFARIAEYAVRAERLGFDSVWLSDHFFFSLERYGGPPGPWGAVEPMTALAALARRTSRVRLGTLVLSAAFRHPGMLAKMATTVALLSGGRLELGLGAGYFEPEFRGFGYEVGTPGRRFAALEEALDALRALFTGGPVEYEGRTVTLKGAHNNPPPDPPPPLILGGKGGRRLLGLVAEKADGWNTVWRWKPEDYAVRAKALDAACERAERPPGTVRRTLGLYALVGEDATDLRRRFDAMVRWMPGGALDGTTFAEWREGVLAGTPEECLERISEYAALGVDEVIVSVGPLVFSVFDDATLELLGERVIPEAGRL